jgi:phosphoglycolate phosphatase
MAQRLAALTNSYDFFPGIPEALRSLASFADIYVVSSNDSAVVQKFMDKHGLTVYREVLGGDKDTSKVRKIRSVARQHPGAPVIYVGDTLGDMAEAREGGAISVGAAWGWHGADRLLAARPDHLLQAPHELAACISRISHAASLPPMSNTAS